MLLGMRAAIRRILFSIGSRLTYESGINDHLLLEDGTSFLLLEPQ